MSDVQLKKFFVSFQIRYRRDKHPKLPFDPLLPDKYLLVLAPDYDVAREWVVNILGMDWGFMYHPIELDRHMSFFPHGELGKIIDGKLILNEEN